MKISFIGVGNMGGAILRGMCGEIDPKNIFITDYFADKARETAKNLGCTACDGNESAVKYGEIIFLCVKPQTLPELLGAISPTLNASIEAGEKKCLVSIAAGVTVSSIRKNLSGICADMPIIRVMPNITASVQKGMLAITSDGSADAALIDQVRTLLKNCGRIDDLPEKLFDQFTVISGCLPAYVFMLIEALADGAVLCGLPRDKAMEYAAQTIEGSAAMFLQNSAHPGALKDMVCSPGGSTITGLAALEAGGFRASVINAVTASYRRNVELGE